MTYEENIKRIAEKYGYDVEKAFNDWWIPNLVRYIEDPPWYGGWDDVIEFVNESKKNEEYFWEVVATAEEDCDSPVEFWITLSACFESMVMEGNPWVEDDEEEFDFTND